MIKDTMIVLVVALALAACTAPIEGESDVDDIATVCSNDGYSYGTSEFAGCLVREYARRDNNTLAAARTTG